MREKLAVRLVTHALTVAAALVLMLPARQLVAQAGDPAMGTWVLNVAKSKYEPGPPPKSLMRTYMPAANGYTFTSDGVGASGQKQHVEFTAVFDGKYHPMTGTSTSDAIMVKRIDARNVESIQKKGAKEVTRTTRVVSNDGKVLTSTAKGTDAAGKPTSNVEVFEKK